MQLKLKMIFMFVALCSTSVSVADKLAIVGGTVYTVVDDEPIQNGVILVEDGRIKSIGSDLTIPPDAQIIDARGAIVTPGLFDSSSGWLGVAEILAVPSSIIGDAPEPLAGPLFDVSRNVDPDANNVKIALIGGVTSAIVAPMTGENPRLFAGQSSIAHLGSGARFNGGVAAIELSSLGDVSSFGAELQLLHEVFADARDYRAVERKTSRGEPRDYVLPIRQLRALWPILDGKRPLVVPADSSIDIVNLIQFVDEEDIRVIISGGAAAWKHADELAARDIPVLVNPHFDLPRDFETIDATKKSGPLLQQGGVAIAVTSSMSEGTRNIRFMAGDMVANGMPWIDGLRSVTSTPARIWGLSKDYGTLEVGKIANIVLWTGDPLDVISDVVAVIVDGVPVELVSRQTLLRDRYKDIADRRRYYTQ